MLMLQWHLSFIFCLFIYFLLYYLASLIETFNASASECLGIILIIRKTYIEHEPGAKTSDGSRPRAEGGERGEGDCFTYPAGFSSFCDFFSFYPIYGGGKRGPRAPPLDLPLKTTFVYLKCVCIYSVHLKAESGSLSFYNASYWGSIIGQTACKKSKP